ncbi:hypothetical protein FOA43_003535 [Brettanomyces nanus]|uniref:DUF4112 domain-containing protein n=1 Tax=Eeniella nana TaxID=13502 RepID=A0A875S908_EENNA|nr:uncharacterized protein FOA43_003535 [Brettanomyces nanus]QPG76149.1 hypothetical protein FOA43_003535 [Brettanomyces nanus]
MMGKLDEDPYMEVIPEDQLKFWQLQGSKRTRGIPSSIPQEKKEPLRRIQNMAYRMDACFKRIGIRVGLGGLIGLIPAIGDIVVLILNAYIFSQIVRVDNFPYSVTSKMVYNLVLDFVLGLIPIVGDIFSIGYRANTRNFTLARDYMVSKYSVKQPSTGVSHQVELQAN